MKFINFKKPWPINSLFSYLFIFLIFIYWKFININNHYYQLKPCYKVQNLILLDVMVTAARFNKSINLYHLFVYLYKENYFTDAWLLILMTIKNGYFEQQG